MLCACSRLEGVDGFDFSFSFAHKTLCQWVLSQSDPEDPELPFHELLVNKEVPARTWFERVYPAKLQFSVY